MKQPVFYFLLFTVFLALQGCGSAPQYQEHFNVPKNTWTSSFRPEFHIDIEDTAAAYQLLFLVRHTDNYPFNNIWLQLETKSPGDTVFHKMKVEVPLAAPTGRWLGRGMGELYEQSVAINSEANPAYFQKKGTYAIRMSQVMRVDALPEVMQVGLRLNNLSGPSRR